MAGGYVLDLREVDGTQVAVVGGKGAHLGELSRIEGVRVPPGFCVTTDAFRRVVGEAPSIDDQLDRLSRLTADDRDGDPHAQRGDPPDPRRRSPSPTIWRRRSPTRSPARRAGRLRRPLERDGGGPADGLLRRPAGLVPERRGAGGDPPARQPVLGLAVHRAGRDLPPAQRLRPPEGPHGRRRAADGRPARGRRPLHGGPRHGQPEGRLGGGRPRPRRGPGLRPGEPGPLQGARRRGRRQGRVVTGAAGADGCAGRSRLVAARPADRSALRPPPGHRVVPGRRRLPDRPEPADHHAVPRPRGRRRREPRLRLGRSRADDDRPHEAPRALRLAADGPPADARGRREAVRRRRPAAGVAGDPRQPSSRPWARAIR